MYLKKWLLKIVLSAFLCEKTDDKLFSTLIPIGPLRLFLLRPHQAHEELRKNNILAKTSLWNVVQAIVNRAELPPENGLVLLRQQSPRYPFDRGLVEWSCVGF